MKLNTLKGKLLIGVIVVGLLSSVGIAFANSNAGEALKEWYDGAFNQSVDEATEEATAYGEDVFEDLLSDFEALLDDAGENIDATRAEELEAALEEIKAARDEHIGSLGESGEEIASQMQFQFYNVYMEEWLELENLAAEAEAAATEELETYTDDEGEAAINQLTQELTDAKEAAVSELEDEIEAAKAELSSLLDDHSQNLVSNLKKNIDFLEDDLRKDVTTLKESLVEVQQGLIAEKAAELTQDAKDSLDDVVSEINN